MGMKHISIFLVNEKPKREEKIKRNKKTKAKKKMGLVMCFEVMGLGPNNK